MLRTACTTGAFLLSSCSVLLAAGFPGIWLDIPFVKQQTDGCGAASIAMVMRYWQQKDGEPGDVDAEYTLIQHALLSRKAHGIYASEMERYFQQNGYSAFAFTGNWDDLTHHLEKGRPVIVALRPGFRMPLHYVVVAGFDQEQQVVLLNDPARRKLLKEDEQKFEQEWKAAGNWTLLALPKPAAH
jgi:ABC-type bacteriocin/lantibiotic exporter with double-glycine peptidase domain